MSDQVKYLLASLIIAVSVGTAYCQPSVDCVLVKKSERKLVLLQNGEIIKSYKISLGGNPNGHKEREGDQRTPEGQYLLDYKKNDSSFYKAIHISYPNDQDLERAAQKKVKPGGQIMIHGQPNGYGEYAWLMQRFDWTNGCIAVTDREMDEIWNMVEVNTPIIIEK